jgi:NAD(P)-dependent dehydrogenase (short-subunit alcohol dehydrogenase family)
MSFNTHRQLPDVISSIDTKARVTVNTVSPGMVNTGLSRFMPRWQRVLLSPLSYMFMRSPAQGADSVVFAAMSHDLSGVSGKFISNRKFIMPSEKAQNAELALQVWKESERLVKWKKD